MYVSKYSCLIPSHQGISQIWLLLGEILDDSHCSNIQCYAGSLEARANPVPEGDAGDGEEDAEPQADRQGGRRDDVTGRQRIRVSRLEEERNFSVINLATYGQT